MTERERFKCIRHDEELEFSSGHGPFYQCPVEGCREFVDYGHGRYMRGSTGTEEIRGPQ